MSELLEARRPSHSSTTTITIPVSPYVIVSVLLTMELDRVPRDPQEQKNPTKRTHSAHLTRPAYHCRYDTPILFEQYFCPDEKRKIRRRKDRRETVEETIDPSTQVTIIIIITFERRTVPKMIHPRNTHTKTQHMMIMISPSLDTLHAYSVNNCKRRNLLPMFPHPLVRILSVR